MSLRRHLSLLREASAPHSDFRERLLCQLVPRKAFHWPRAVAFPVAVVALFFGTGIGAYAYASPEVTDQHPFYPVKRGLEQIQAVVQFSDDAQADFHARMMERRLQEAEVLLRLRAMQDQQVQAMEQELQASLSHIDEGQLQRNREVIGRLQRQQARMQMLREQMQTGQQRPSAPTDENVLRSTLFELRIKEGK